MIHVLVTDLTAESRSRIYERLSSFLLAQVSSAKHLLPQLNIRSVSNHELRFQSMPDICVIGREIVESDPSEIRRVRGVFPETMILVESLQENLIEFEQLVRFGANDTFSETITASEFFKKVILLSQRENQTRIGKIVLIDSGKGGVGVTSIAAAFGESLSRNKEKKVALIDLDLETQDLTRFLRVRPYFNENLQSILNQQCPVTQESVECCVTPIWEGDRGFVCMAPPSDADGGFEIHISRMEGFLRVLQCLDSLYDIILIDVGSIRGAALRALYEIANHIIFVINNDPAALHASVDKLRRLSSSCSFNNAVTILENNSQRGGLSSGFLKNEFLKISLLEPSRWCNTTIPHCDAGLRWPGSGFTLVSASHAKKMQDAFDNLARHMGMKEELPLPTPGNFFRSVTDSAKAVISIPFTKQNQKLLPAPAMAEMTRDANLITGATLYDGAVS